MHCHPDCSVPDHLPTRRLTASLGALAAGFGLGLAWSVHAQEQGVDPAPAEAEVSTLRKITVKGKKGDVVVDTDELPRNAMGKVQKNILRENVSPPKPRA